ncbi:MAG: outer membrane protein assembly factor BamC [Chromatiales bacterium]|nr:outer membrane protein assembly factor BamC [Chromatiales bacterium]
MPNRDAEFKSARRLPKLDIPPDLSSTQVGERFQVPRSGVQSARDWEQQGAGVSTLGTEVLPIHDDIRVERDGDKRWLVVNATPAQVWPRIRDFWAENQFLIRMEDPSIGILETDWAENRADIPKGVIENLLSKISERIYSAATRDKFRTRLERGVEPNTTEIYISHRGAQEVRGVDNSDQSRIGGESAEYRWAPRPADPELEVIMLRRMMVYFGVTSDTADQRIATTRDAAPRAHLGKDNGGRLVLALREDFSRAWQRTGLALDRVGFTVEDRDRSRGLYFVRYVDPRSDGAKESGFFDKLKLWGDKDEAVDSEYLISLEGGENTTQVVVLDKRGEQDNTRTGARILSLLHDELK